MEPEIIIRYDEKGNQEFGKEMVVKPIGSGGHVVLPKTLVGRKVIVLYLTEKEK